MKKIRMAVAIAFAAATGMTVYYGVKNDAATKEQPLSGNVAGTHALEVTVRGQKLLYAQYPDFKSCESGKDAIATELAWTQLVSEKNPRDAGNPVRLAAQVDALKRAGSEEPETKAKERLVKTMFCHFVP